MKRLLLGSSIALVPLFFFPFPGASQAIRGTVVSAAGTPLADASVVLFDEAFQRRATATSDAEGRFTFAGLDPGEYVLTVERPGHASVVSPPLEVRSGETVVHRMVADAPTLEEVAGRSRAEEARQAFLRRVTSACGALGERGDGAMLAGTVRDTLSGLAVPDVEVVLRWTDPEGGEARRTAARTSPEGSYVICDAPSGEEVVLAVERLGHSGDLLAVTLDPGTAHRLDVPVDASVGEAPGQVVGRVLEYETGRGVSNAEVRFGGGAEAVTAVTNTRGYFVLRDVRPGRHMLAIRHIGYGDQEQSFVVLPGQAHEIEVRLVTEAIELEPIEVTVRSERWMYFMDGLQFRMRKGGGHFLLPEDIAMRGPGVPVGSLLEARVPRVRWVRGRGHDAAVIIGTMRNHCRPSVWVDGVEMGIPILAVDGFTTSEIEAVEVYTHPASVPGEFGGGLETCGAVVIWTRRR